MFTFNAPDFMFSTYKMEYDFGFIGVPELRTYVQNGSLTQAGFKEITGSDYDGTQNEQA